MEASRKNRTLSSEIEIIWRIYFIFQGNLKQTQWWKYIALSEMTVQNIKVIYVCIYFVIFFYFFLKFMIG